MPTVFDVADYFLSKVSRETEGTITHIKLQKLIYYAQAWSMVFRGSPIFQSEIQAWKHGPVAAEAWTAFSRHGYASIPLPNVSVDFSNVFTPDDLKVLTNVWNTYGSLSSTKLRNLTHNEYPWRKARKGLPDDASSNETILLSDMKDYYESFVSLGNDRVSIRISEKAILENKDEELENVIALTDEDGDKEWVRTNRLWEHFQAQGEDRPFVKIEVRRPYIPTCR